MKVVLPRTIDDTMNHGHGPGGRDGHAAAALGTHGEAASAPAPSPASRQQSSSDNPRAPPRRVDHTYRDYSNFPPQDLPPGKADKPPRNFPSKLHAILSTPEYAHVSASHCLVVVLLCRVEVEWDLSGCVYGWRSRCMRDMRVNLSAAALRGSGSCLSHMHHRRGLGRAEERTATQYRALQLMGQLGMRKNSVVKKRAEVAQEQWSFVPMEHAYATRGSNCYRQHTRKSITP